MNIIDFFDRGVTLDPDRLCLVDGEQTLTYKDTQTLTHKIALALHREGLSAGNRVAILSPNHLNGFLTLLGLFRAGTSFVPVNARGALDENITFLKDAGAEWLFYHSKFEHDAVAAAAALPGLRGCVCLDKESPDAPYLLDWIEGHEGEVAGLPEDPDRIAFLGATGGTTGKSKVVCITDRNVETMTAAFLSAMPCDEPPVHLLVAPVTHAAGAVAYPLLALGGTQVIMAEVDPEAIMQAIERYKITHIFLPPTVIYVMLSHPNVRNYDYSSLKYFIYAAAPMSTEKLRQAMDVFGPVMVQCFGQAEAPLICTVLTAKDHLEAIETGNEHRLRSCGRASPFGRVAVMDYDGNLLPPNHNGEIVVRSSLVMKGYYNNPEATAEASTYGWHHTGDIGFVDEDGFVYIVDRKRDMIITGGFNVFPSEIEQVIWSHEAVQDCAVIGVPDDKWGEAVKAVIELVPGASATEVEIIALCKEKLGSVKAPKTVEFWEALPKSAVGKVLKKAIRSRFWEGKDRAV